MNKVRNLILVLGIALGLGVFAPASVYAADSVIAGQCEGVSDSAVCDKAQSANAQPSKIITNIVSILLFIVGALSVVVIIVGGILYVTSAGDSSRVTLAKNTITYAVIGFVVSFLAFAVVQFVVTKFTT